MAACARKEIIRPDQPGIFHCWSRCVRRAWLMGRDPLTGRDFEHRRGWVVERLKLLVSCFAIDVGFLAILSNHLHLVLRAMPQLTKRWTDEQVARRWLRAYSGRHTRADEPCPEPTEKAIEKLVKDRKRLATVRKRLGDVSWFMANLKENIARWSNAEDDASGHFWEDRFACRELLDETSLLICGMYVDLNQIRAQEAQTPEESLWCSVGLRIQAEFADGAEPKPDSWLAPLTLNSSDLGDVPCTQGHRASDKGLLPISLQDYMKLVDFAGRQTREGKSGVIPADLEPILVRLGIINASGFLAAVTEQFPRLFKRLAGTAAQMQARAQEMKRKWVHGVRAARKLIADKTPPPPPPAA